MAIGSILLHTTVRFSFCWARGHLSLPTGSISAGPLNCSHMILLLHTVKVASTLSVVPDALSMCYSVSVSKPEGANEAAYDIFESHLPAVASAMTTWAEDSDVDSASVSYMQVLETELYLPVVAATSALYRRLHQSLLGEIY